MEKEIKKCTEFNFISRNRNKFSVSEMCRVHELQGFRKSLNEKSYKHATLLARIKKIYAEHELNTNYGVIRIYEALNYKFGSSPSISTVRRVMRENNLIRPANKPKGLTKADKEAQKSENLLNRDFTAEKPNQKWVSDISEVPTKQKKLYVSGILDCFDNVVAPWPIT